MDNELEYKEIKKALEAEGFLFVSSLYVMIPAGNKYYDTPVNDGSGNYEEVYKKLIEYKASQ